MNHVRARTTTGDTVGHPPALTRATPPSDGECETCDAWLTLFDGLLHLPPREKESIRDEIGSHLKERVRDLLLEGYNETNAIHAATRELGDAAELAKKFESVARGRTRRTVMHFAILGMGLATVVTAGILVLEPTVSDWNNEGVSVFQEAEPASEPPAAASEGSITITPDMTLREIAAAIAETSGVGIVVDWGRMEELGLIAGDVPTEMGLDAEPAAPLTLLRLIQLHSGDSLDWRFRGETLELGAKEDFDLRERVLASYDISSTVARLRNAYEMEYADATAAITQLITEFVEPELWEDNGGAIGQLEVVGGTLFINAPPRMHERTAWILNELGKQGEAGAPLELEPMFEHDAGAPRGSGEE